MKNLFNSTDPEQVFWALRSEILDPLLTIQGYTKVIQEDIASKGTDIESIVKGIKAIEDSAQRIHGVLDKIADSLRE